MYCGWKGVSERERKNVCQRAHDDPSYTSTTTSRHSAVTRWKVTYLEGRAEEQEAKEEEDDWLFETKGQPRSDLSAGEKTADERWTAATTPNSQEHEKRGGPEGLAGVERRNNQSR